VFSRWPSPFENRPIELLEVHFSVIPGQTENGSGTGAASSGLNGTKGSELTLHLRVASNSEELRFKVSFDWIHAFRVLDEGALLGLWIAKSKLTTPVGLSSFRINSPAMLSEWVDDHFAKDRKTYFIAGANECVEVLADCIPSIELEGPE